MALKNSLFFFDKKYPVCERRKILFSFLLFVIHTKRALPGNHRAGIRHCAPSKTLRKFVVKLARVRKKRGFTSTSYSSESSSVPCPLWPSFIFLFSFPRFDALCVIRGRTINLVITMHNIRNFSSDFLIYTEKKEHWMPAIFANNETIFCVHIRIESRTCEEIRLEAHL